MKLFVVISILLIGFISVNVLPDAFSEPTLSAPDLVVEKYVPNLCCLITTMTFVGDDILILQKSDGQVRLIRDGILQDRPVLDVNVNSEGEKGCWASPVWTPQSISILQRQIRMEENH